MKNHPEATIRLVEWNMDNILHLLTEIDLVRNTSVATLWTPDDTKQDIPFLLNENIENVKSELEIFMSDIASFYGDLPFHCFPRASHVAMSVMTSFQPGISREHIVARRICITSRWRGTYLARQPTFQACLRFGGGGS